jgi:signal transduction histidine kinase
MQRLRKMSLGKLKIFFTKHLLIITIIFPLLLIFLYGTTISFVLKYRHKLYIERELDRYEHELKNKHKNFLKEKAKYIESFMEIMYVQELNLSKVLPIDNILKFVDSIKKYDSGFIFIFRKDGIVIKHPCADTLIGLVHANNKKTILSRLIQASKDEAFIYYEGTNCIDNDFINKIGFVHHIKTTDLYIVISKNEKDIDYSVERKKKLWESKLNDELDENIMLLSIISIISLIFSLLFSKFLNILIRDYEKEIKESNEAMFSQARLAQAGELISMISHQWRQPISKIASIIANLRFQMMMGSTLDSEALDKTFEEIEEYTEFLSETIDDFREFYKPKKDKELVYILPLIEKSISFLENSLMKKNINLIRDFDENTKLLLYQNELMQVLINIIQNAIEFSENGNFIKVETLLKPKEYIIRITDEAGGIDDNYIDKVFDAHFSTKVSKDSTNLGLGLYVSKVIIENHFNGKLEVTSEDIGSTFTIRLIR